MARAVITANEAIKRRKGSQHDKTGCLTCRYRRKKCVENTHPTCGSCSRLNLKCIRDLPRNIIPSRAEAPGPSRPSDSSVLTITPAFCTLPQTIMPAAGVNNSPGRSAQHRYAMRYYVSELANHFTVSMQFNSFLSDFLPMAVDSPALWDSLVTLASRHISLSDPSYAVVSLEAQASAIRNLKSSINSPLEDITWHETNAATCLIFSMGLISTGDGKGWYTHMQGAKQFIISTKRLSSSGEILHGTNAFKRTAEGQWVLRNFAYHDILGCVTLRKRPLLEPSYLDDISDLVDSYAGVGTGLLRYVAQIAILDDEISEVDKMQGDQMASFQTRWALIEDELHCWTCPFQAEESLSSMAYAYRSVALILLYRTICKQLRARHHVLSNDNAPDTMGTLVELLESKIAFQVAGTLRYVSAIPVWAAAEASLLFPLFVAGGEARKEEHIHMIRTRLGQILAKRSFQNISHAIEVLECLWRRRRVPGSGPVDWEEILEELDEELVLT